MKTQFKRVEAELRYNRWLGMWYTNDWAVGRYELLPGSYHRSIRTNNERRQNYYAIHDGYKVRGRRRPSTLPTSNDDFNISRNWKRSWKDFTKYRKQYLKNLD